MIVDPTIPARTGKPGRHRVREGAKCPDTGRIVGGTPAQFKATVVIRRHGGDLEPRTRRAE